MSNQQPSYTRPVRNNRQDQLQVQQVARAFIGAYPDLHGMARAAAAQLLYQHTGRKLNPEKVYWHRFDGSTAGSSDKAFTGWEHYARPSESMTLVELLMRRFSVHDQDNSDLLQVSAGFYTDPAEHGVFDERNEVAMRPQDVLKDFWALDFSSSYNRALERFWAEHSEHFCLLARANLMAAATADRRSGHLGESDFQAVRASVANGLQEWATLKGLRSHQAEGGPLTLRTFDLGGLVARGALRMVSAHGWQILYLPGQQPALRRFEDAAQLYDWVRGQLADESSRSLLLAQMLHNASTYPVDLHRLQQQVYNVLQQPWREDQRLLNVVDQHIQGDPFVYWRDQAQQQMRADARLLLTSNADLRKQLWIGYFSAFLRVFGSMAPLATPLALVCIGAGVVSVALNLDQAINANRPQLRKAGVIGTVVNLVYVLFSTPLLAGTAPTAAVAEQASAIPDVSGLEGNEIVGEPALVGGEGRWRGVSQVNQQAWISMDSQSYRVIYSEHLEAWTIVDPQNPFAFYGARPVRLNALGEWELQPLPKLRGGTPPMQAAGASVPQLARSTSQFWDTYMQVDQQAEEALNEAAEARQKSLMEVPQATDEQIDDQGRYIDEEGDSHGIYQDSDGMFHAENIAYYTQSSNDFNQYLRTGEAAIINQVKIIEDLVDELETLPKNNAVALYRGGSGLRGTSGASFRSGQIKVGDTLVNTDISSFSENPYVARTFSSSQAGEGDSGWGAGAQPVTFDDTSVVFVLPTDKYSSAIPVAPFSSSAGEAESIVLPGHYFQVVSIEELVGVHYRFIKVELSEIYQPAPGRGLFDLRTGEPFSRQAYASKLGQQGQVLVDRFFPVA